LDIIDLNELIGVWKSLDGNSEIIIRQDGLEFLMSGNYFPGVLKYGDKALVSFEGRLGYIMNQGRREQINTAQKGNTVGYKVRLTLFYETSVAQGGGGSGIEIGYSPQKVHLFVGCPPINKLVNGKWISSSSFSSGGVYGKEFKRFVTKTTKSGNTSIIDPLPDSEKIKIDLLNNKIGSWSIDYLEEIKAFRIISFSSNEISTEFKIFIELGAKEYGAKYKAEILVKYLLNGNEWDFQNINTTMFDKH